MAGPGSGRAMQKHFCLPGVLWTLVEGRAAVPVSWGSTVQDRARSYSKPQGRWRQHMVSNVNKGFGDFSSLPSLRP